jgi:hypothetical protein
VTLPNAWGGNLWRWGVEGQKDLAMEAGLRRRLDMDGGPDASFVLGAE